LKNIVGKVNVAVIIIMIALFASLLPTGHAQADNPSISVSPACLEVENSANFTLDILVNTSLPIRGWQLVFLIGQRTTM
jgi:hypothetical protein